MKEKRSGESHLLSVGDKAPTFSLRDQDGNLVTLGEFKAKKNVVLVFYPGDNTPGCTKQLCAIRDQFELFADNDTVVFGINPQDPASHKKFISKRSLPFPLLVDGDKKVIAAYGCRGMLMTKRTVYGINMEGTIVFSRRGTPANEEILSALKEK
jgi:peroxiredoxin Q/BCP